MEFEKIIDMVNRECRLQGRCSECDFEYTCRLCDATLPQVLNKLKYQMDFINDNDFTPPVRCPHCGSTAQVTHNGYVDLCGDGKMYKHYVCGCGCIFVRTGI